jgi:hypothetical protein
MKEAEGSSGWCRMNQHFKYFQKPSDLTVASAPLKYVSVAWRI